MKVFYRVSIMLALCGLSIGAINAQTTWDIGTPTATDVQATLTGGTLTITGTGQMGDFSPSAVAPWYNQRNAITAVDIQSGVTSIGDWAFNNCTNLTSVTIPASVTSIGSVAFSNCTGLTAVTIPTSVTTIGGGAFGFCTGLTAVTIPASVTSIGNDVFSGCTGLTSIDVAAGNLNYSSDNGVLFDKAQTVLLQCPAGKTGTYTIPASVTTIDQGAFYNCTNLTSVTIPASVTSIGNQAFFGCSGLPSIDVAAGNLNYSSDNGVLFDKAQTVLLQCPAGKTGTYAIPNSVTSIGNQAFSYCSGLTSVTIPNSVTSIGDRAFYSCSGLTSVTIPASVTSIGAYAFADCDGLTAVTIPASVTSIGNSAFMGCHGLPSIDVAAGNLNYSSDNGVLFDKAQTVLLQCPAGKTGTYAIPASVTTIGDAAFALCNGLTSVTIPNSVTTIGGSAFYNCNGLTSVTIPESVTYIGKVAFNNCQGLTSIDVDAANLNYSSDNGVLLDKAQTVILQCPAGKTGTYDIPASVTTIGDFAFEFCDRFTSVTIPASVTTIGVNAFWGCSGLTAVTLSASVTSIGVNAFFSCRRLTSITCLNSTPPALGSDVFNGVDQTTCTLYVPAGSTAAYQGDPRWAAFTNIVEPVCEITTGGTTVQYFTLDDALAAVNAGETITLLNDITNYDTYIENKNITIDLNGKNLVFKDTSDDALNLKNSNLAFTGTGTVKADATNHNGIDAWSGSTLVMNGSVSGYWGILAADAGTTVTITGDVTATNGAGVVAATGSKVTVNGNVKSGDPTLAGYFGVSASNGSEVIVTGAIDADMHGVYAGANAQVTVNSGNVTATDGNGVVADTGSKVTVNGNVKSGDPTLAGHWGVSASNGSEVIVTGNIDTDKYGVYAGGGSTVTVEGTITATAGEYIYIGSVAKAKTDNDATSTKTGYLQYTDASSAGTTVWVREPAALVNAATPTITAQPQNATVTTGSSVTLSVTATVPAGTLSYQWYNGNGAAIPGATASTYSPPTATAGTYTYYVVVTNTNNSATGTKTATTTSSTVTVTVNADVNPPVPPVVQRQIILPQPPEGVLVQPSYGIHYVEIYHDFTFKLTFLHREIYEVHTSRMTPDGKQEELAGKKNANGEYEYTIYNVIMQPVYVYIGPNTLVANDKVEKSAVLKAWTTDGTLHVSGLTPGKPWSVYSITGYLIYQGIAGSDTETLTATAPLNRGIYIVTHEGRSVKVIL